MAALASRFLKLSMVPRVERRSSSSFSIFLYRFILLVTLLLTGFEVTSAGSALERERCCFPASR